MTKEQVKEILEISKAKEEYQEALKNITHSDFKLVYNLYSEYNFQYVDFNINATIREILDKHNDMIINELKQKIEDIDKQLEEL